MKRDIRGFDEFKWTKISSNWALDVLQVVLGRVISSVTISIFENYFRIKIGIVYDIFSNGISNEKVFIVSRINFRR